MIHFLSFLFSSLRLGDSLFSRVPVDFLPRSGSTHHLFDEMDKRAAGTGEDPFRVLPEDLLEHILSFLPRDDALQTCVLDTQWRDHWRRKTSLRFIYKSWSGTNRSICKRLNQLAKLIIDLRGNSPLTDCQINPRTDDEEGIIYFTETKLLIEYVLKCRVEKLSVCNDHFGDEPLLLDGRLISEHLKTIEFDQLDLVESSVDFSGCPVLEELTIKDCHIETHILSKSLKHLWLTGPCCSPPDFRIHIDAPRLISLQLNEFYGKTPLLGKMPLLETAYVMLGYLCNDSCETNRVDCDDPSCVCYEDECLLLDGLSNAVDLELIADPKVYVYTRDLECLEWCSKFDKLKRLILNEWFTAIDLVCILQHSPNLEKLTLKLDAPENFVGATGSKQSFVCAPHLVVNIECREVDKGVRKILKVLSTCGILREQISIKCRSLTQLLPSTDWDQDMSSAWS